VNARGSIETENLKRASIKAPASILPWLLTTD